jgi:hypothetical protein
MIVGVGVFVIVVESLGTGYLGNDRTDTLHIVAE